MTRGGTRTRKAQLPPDRHYSAPLSLLAETTAGTAGWRAWSIRHEDIRADLIVVADVDGRQAKRMVADSERRRVKEPLWLDVEAVESAVKELQWLTSGRSGR